MDDLLKLVKTFRLMSENPAERVRLADAIFTLLDPEIRRFVHARLPDAAAAEDVAQEALRDISLSISKFTGDTRGEFFGFCYTIAWRRICDYLNKKRKDPFVPLPEEELWARVESSAKVLTLSAAERMDLKEGIDILIKAMPECFDLIWKHYIIELEHAEVGEELAVKPGAARMRFVRCLEDAQELLKRKLSK